MKQETLNFLKAAAQYRCEMEFSLLLLLLFFFFIILPMGCT